MRVWKRETSLERFMFGRSGTLAELLDMRIVEVGDDFARATMPVDERHIQPFGLLHGGASVALAETLGSYCSMMAAPEGKVCVGIEINANHLLAVERGDQVEAVARPLQIGGSLQVWQIEIRRGDGRLSCVSRLTTAVRDLRPPRPAEGVAAPPAKG